MQAVIRQFIRDLLNDSAAIHQRFKLICDIKIIAACELSDNAVAAGICPIIFRSRLFVPYERRSIVVNINASTAFSVMNSTGY